LLRRDQLLSHSHFGADEPEPLAQRAVWPDGQLVAHCWSWLSLVAVHEESACTPAEASMASSSADRRIGVDIAVFSFSG
ncbi:MAG TPA: hypothetical protein PK144_05905, partial [Plasticicumulans sp.]|nr:hypothetical protein [Plasticicumulans sp.]HNI22881.1 hypothetical protein [Plasticicumulans sp.]